MEELKSLLTRRQHSSLNSDIEMVKVGSKNNCFIWGRTEPRRDLGGKTESVRKKLNLPAPL